MKIIFAGLVNNRFEKMIGGHHRLLSYYEMKDNQKDSTVWAKKIKRRSKLKSNKRPILFLDSGAFSAFTRNETIDINEYIEYIYENIDVYDTYAALDVIGDPDKTYSNTREMIANGLNPLPVFHYGSDTKYLKKLIDNFEYIALGGMVPISTKELKKWLDNIWQNFLTDEKGKPVIRVHGFGMTTLHLLKRYPWYSVDSIAPVLAGGLGRIYIPKKNKGVYDYSKSFTTANVSNRDDIAEKITSKSKKQQIIDYLKYKKVPLGKSTFHKISANASLRPDQKVIKKYDDYNLMEHVWKSGISNDNILRRVLNVEFYHEIEKAINKGEQRLSLPTEAKARIGCSMFSNIKKVKV